MPPLSIVTWLWGDKYDENHVAKLFNGIDRHLEQDYRAICFVDKRRELIPPWIEQIIIPDLDLTKPGVSFGCVRLRLFDIGLQQSLDLHGRIVNFDLDCVILGKLDPLFDRPEPFVIMQEVNLKRPNRYSGSLFMLESGYRSDVWSVWDVNRRRGRVEWSDEVWLSAMIPNAPSWTGRKDGVWAYRKGYWEGGAREWGAPQTPPENARIIFFTGKNEKPLSQYMNQAWFAENWR